MNQQCLMLLALLWLACVLLVSCATPVITAQPHATSTVVAPTATDDPFVINVCHTCDVQQRRMQATITR